MSPRKDLASKLVALQDRINGDPALMSVQGKKYWRTLEELADTQAFQELIREEYPEQAPLWPQSLSRRQFLSLMGASLALAGLSGCSVRPAPTRTMVPRVRAPEETVPGRPLFYATAMTMAGAGVGLLVESHMGRPTKIEGNPDHPASLGATDIFHQASILDLYDPDRSQNITHLGQTRTWEDALNTFRSAMAGQRQRRGGGLRLLTETVVSPTLGRQLKEFLDAFPEAKWHQYEPLARAAAYRGSQFAYGEHVNTTYDFRAADIVLALDADFLSGGPGSLRYVSDFMGRRRVRATPQAAEMNRLYVAEPNVSTTGAKADHRLALRAGEIEKLARGIAARLGVAGVDTAEVTAQRRWIGAVCRDLERHRGRSIVLAGERQPAAVHLLAHVLNHHLGNVGRTVLFTAPIEVRPTDQIASLRELVDDMAGGSVEVLVILGGNPVFTAPADFRFSERLEKVPLRFHLSLFQDETSRQCHWHLPEAHYLEAWSDTRAFDGAASIAQPLIEPLYQGRSAHEVLSVLMRQELTPAYESVRDTWREHWENVSSEADFERRWQSALHDGVVPETKFPGKTMVLQAGWPERLRGAQAPAVQARAGSYELVFEPDPTIYDGRFANNGWLQELPKPITTLTWDNAALMSPATARSLGVDLGSYAHGGEHGGYHPDVVDLSLGDATSPLANGRPNATPALTKGEPGGVVLRAPIWIVPGHADGSITVSLGYGRDRAGRVGGTAEQRVGFNAYPLRTSTQPGFAQGLTVRRTGDTALVACTQQHHLMENRDIVRSGTLEQYRENPHFAKDKENEHPHTPGERRPLTMYQPFPYPERKWGMLIDLTACTGCKACVVACQSENNIPVVGKEQVAAGREMHWLRIDRYIEGPEGSPREFHFQPVPCMHCENAPCEYVCPTEATNHSADGLNDMVYQRCVGTRFCSNNCPYKVRRFNFFHYADFTTESLRMQYNPDVTVRSRGVMEKCSYCVQRIRRAEIDADVEERALVDGDILTACQAACPAQAIIFGDINDRNSAVKRGKDSPLHYGLLADLNTNPRTTYLAALRNPNPELEGD